MADDPYRRSYRPGDRARPADAPAGARDAAPDPLVELARLIGQNDPFAFDSGRGAGRRDPRDRSDPYDDRHASDDRDDSRATASDRFDPRYPQAPAADPYPSGPYPSGGRDRWPPADSAGDRYDDRYASPQGGQPDPAGYGDPRYPGDGDARYGAAEDERYRRGFDQGYDPGQGQAYQAGDYAEDYRDEPSDRDDYDVPRSRRRGPLMVAAVLALAVIGTAAAFGYRSMSQGSVSVPPPLIKADNAPNKVASATQAGDANKQIYERLGDRSQGERVVSREEQPVDIRDAAPRVLVPVLSPFPPETQAPAPIAPAVTATTPRAPSGAATEPKKIRTVTIRPDQPADATAARAAPAQRAAKPAGNAPLSLNPQGEPAPVAPRSIPSRTAMASPPPRAAETGNYVVQLSAQKSESEAQASFRAMQAKYPSVLSGRQPLIRKKDLGSKGIYYGAQVGPFASREQAVRLCEDLKSAGGVCIVQRN